MVAFEYHRFVCVGLLSLVIAKSPSFGSMIPGSVGGCFDSEALFSRFDRWVCDDHLSTQHPARSFGRRRMRGDGTELDGRTEWHCGCLLSLC